MICASLYRPFFIVNLLRYLAEKMILLNTANFGGMAMPEIFDGIEFKDEINRIQNAARSRVTHV